MPDIDTDFLELERRGNCLYQSCVFHLLAGKELHPGQLPILWAIARMGPVSQGQVARALGVSRAAVAVSAKRLEKAGLVRREKGGSGDQRRTMVALTPKGRAVAQAARSCQEELLARRLEGFSPEELSSLMGFYERMNQNLERYRQRLEEREANHPAGEEVVC